MFWSIFVDFLALGVLVALVGWLFSNFNLRVQGVHTVEQKVEWLYAFDIHCNSFFPLFLILYVVQFLLLPVLLVPESFFATFLSNTLYAIAFVYYFYLTFLGYNGKASFIDERGEERGEMSNKDEEKGG
eukprot:TRINITY_DN7364_c0_g1_i1.p1 TRINITY_DN7364_c0_g1~~TRINITY_DN7364_c0_g1_i1.p1  ORF type:complete len:129 (-),score=27.69 TRINITY_DN7364_c0_g1_i1:341-727(-)